jgi:cytochrome P450
MGAHETIELDVVALADPYAIYARLRAAEGLVRHAHEGYFLVARYEDVREAAMRPDDFGSRIVEILVRSVRLPPRVGQAVVRFGPVDVLAVEDEPRHFVHRKLSTKHFGRDPVARAVEGMSGVIDRHLDAFFERRGGDFMADVAATLPVLAALMLLGFPERDGPRVKRLTDGSVALLSGLLPERGRGARLRSGLELYGYSLHRFLRHRRAGTGAPLFDAIAAAEREGQLGAREAASVVMQMLIAGSDSTASLLGSATRALAEDPGLACRLRAEPSLVPAFVEEMLRLESPFQGHFRVVRRDTELAGQRLRRGDRLMLLWASANRDERVYEASDAIELDRKRGDKPHLAFGQGIHLCLGAGLARALARKVLERLLERTRTLELATTALRYKPSGFIRTLESLPLRVEPRDETGPRSPRSLKELGAGS